MLKDLTETLGNTHYDFQIEHGGLVPRVRRADNGLDNPCKARPTVPVSRWQVRNGADGTGTFFEMLLPAGRQTVLVRETCANTGHVEIAAMEKEKSGGDMEVVPLDPMESAAPCQWTGKNGGFRVAGA